MARVTKINVGGTNYDIAHEGELKNSGFEVVTSLPTTGLFKGREVMYNGEKYIYINGWNSSTNPIIDNSVLQFPVNGGFNQMWFMMQYSLLLSNNNNCVKREDRLVELIDDETSHVSIINGSYFPSLRVGKTLRWTAFNPDKDGSLGEAVMSNFNSLGLPFSVSIEANVKNANAIYIVEYYKYTNATGDGNTANEANFEWVSVFSKEMPVRHTIIRVLSKFIVNTAASYYIRNIRVTIKPTSDDPNSDIYISNIDVFYYTSGHKSLLNANQLINYDAAIEPTQTKTEFKTLPWWMQYITQGVNWLKANKVALSVYNTKVAALEQADSDNNASIQSVSTDLTELSNGLAAVARSGSYNDLTDTPTLAAVATSGDYNDLLNRPTFSGSYNDLTDTPNLATVATSGSYDDLLNKPALVFQNIGGTISSVQIPDGLIANGKLANSSMTLNGTTVNLGDTSILPWYVDYNEVDYPARIRDHWLQIYRNGVWANLVYLGDILPTQVGQITSLDNLDWYNEQVSEYEVDSNTTTSILNGTTMPATVLMNCLAEKLTLNLYPISGKQYGKGSLDSLISDLKGKGFSVFVENDLDAILSSGSDYLVRIKISKVPTPKAIIECYVAK